MRWKLLLVVVAGGLALTSCSRLDALHFENICDFPVTVVANAQDATAIKTVRPRSESVVLEGWWRSDDPRPITITTVEITYTAEVDKTTLPDLRASVPPAACGRERIELPTLAVVDVGWSGRASTISVAGPPARVDAFGAATADLADATTSLNRTTQHSAELKVWPDQDGTRIAEELLQALKGPGAITVSVCSGGSACRGGPIGADQSIAEGLVLLSPVALPAAERPDPWAAPVGLVLVLGAGVAIWGSTRHRRRNRAQTGT